MVTIIGTVGQPAMAQSSLAYKHANSAVGGDHRRTRFVIGLDRTAQYQVFSLPAPNRVIIDIKDVKLSLPRLPDTMPVGLVSNFRSGLSAPGRTRVVIDVTTPVIVDRATIETPRGAKPQLVLEIVPVEGNRTAKNRTPLKTATYSGLGAGGLQPPLPRPAEHPEDLRAKSFKPIIVVDPGHGGHDTGARKFGVLEKDVVLAFGKMLRDKLEATGRYTVLMTRDSDEFVELDERRAFAERNQAALFIAVHADYAHARARGATIYSLRESVAKALKRSAKSKAAKTALNGKELALVKSSAGADYGTVRDILSDLAEREIEATRDRTSVFTRSVIEFMGQSTNLKDNPDRSAAFRVLKTAQFPSVLIELAYVSNKQDVQLLQSTSWRDKVSTSIATAVDNYFSHDLARLPM